MRFQVPQFIEIEDKIIGPLTIKQFIYIAGGAGMCFVIIRFAGLLWGIMLSLPVAAFALALAFASFFSAAALPLRAAFSSSVIGLRPRRPLTAFR